MDINQKKQHWLTVIEQQKQSGLSISSFCKNNQITVSTFYLWKKRLSEDKADEPALDKKHQLVPLFVTDSVQSNSTITLTTPDGYQLSFGEQLSPTSLSAFVKALQ
ncbi:IS66 family insertion sequence element accessory protein TnpA [Thalassotalea sp. ND16A]|uniref:IS66 family insertion sequence element accessory protein TnpA n=1 Tax=Thalassotalea sp. ND16A TaxID=1535422 RepID=UPI00051A885C|nr:hypothetical protein [Thalassotalea sp. ND16A]KGJ97958.1 hypothetical protein ND16A_0763 [Thalassotalea sp. ND16A]